MMWTIINWILVILAITGTLLNVKKNRWGFVFWIVSNVGLVVYFIHYDIWAQAVLFGVYAMIALWGFVKWSYES